MKVPAIRWDPGGAENSRDEAFFTLMYMKPETQRRAIEEVHRVLAPGGRFLVWEVTIPAKADPVQDVAVFPLRIRMPGRDVTTGYGTFFPDRLLTLGIQTRVAEESSAPCHWQVALRVGCSAL